MKLWIARDKDNYLWLYNNKPQKEKDVFGVKAVGHFMIIDENLFSNVTFENSPQEVELKLVEK